MIVRELIATFGIEVDPKGFKQAESQITNFGNKVKSFLGGLGAAYVANSIKNFIQEQINAADQISKTAERLGVSSKFLQEYSFAADLAGVSQGELNTSLGFFTRQLGGAASGSNEAKKALSELGVTDFKNTENALLQLADGLEKIPTQTQKANKLAKVFGKTGANMFTLFKGGRKEIEKTIERFRRLGGAIGGDTLKQSEEFNDNLTVMGYALKAVANGFITNFLPTFTKFTDKLIKGAEIIIGFVKNSNALTAAFIALGIVMAPLALKALAIVAPFAALVLIIDDLLTLFAGGDSLIGDFIDSIFGVGAAANTVKYLKEQWEIFTSALQNPQTIEYLKNLAMILGIVLLPIILALIAPILLLALKIGLVVGAVAALFYGIKKLAENWESIKQVFIDIGQSISDTFDNIKNKFIAMKDFISNGIQELKGIISSGVDFLIPDFIQNAFKGSASGGAATTPPPLSSPALGSTPASSFNNTANNKVNVTINAGSNSSADDIANKTSEAIRNALEQERRNTFESWRQTIPATAG